MKIRPLLILLFLMTLIATSTFAGEFKLVTFADGRTNGGIRQHADTNNNIDFPGGIFVFDQKLLAENAETVIGRNAGYCIRTDPGSFDYTNKDHPGLPDDPDNNYGQCTWTLSFQQNIRYSGSIVVSGREADLGVSVLPIVGGTGDFLGVVGELTSTPIPQNDGGILFRQELVFSRPLQKRKH